MPSTTNFGWTTPADTDLVKDGAAAIRTLGNGIDTSFLDLKGGTSGQILAKNSATDLDFVWVANDQGDITAVTAGTGISGGGTSGAVTITNSMATEITAKGDLIVGTGNAAFDNLPAGTNGHVLTADSTVSPTGLKWAAPAAGGKILQVVMGTTTSSSTSSSGSYQGTNLSASITPSAATSKVLIMVAQQGLNTDSSSADESIKMRLLRGATQIQVFLLGFAYTNNTTRLQGMSASTVYLDSPNTTSATTYETQFARAFGSGDVVAQANGETSTMILMEVGA